MFYSISFMKFKINRNYFVTGLQQVMNIVGTRSTTPILGNVLIQAEAEQYLTLVTNNLKLGVQCQVKAHVFTKGSITLPVRLLLNIVQSLPSIEVLVELLDGNQVKVTSGGSAYTIKGLGISEFPALPLFDSPSTLVLEQQTLEHMLKSVAYAQSNDETRYTLNGIYFNFLENKLSLVATDGRRLSMVSHIVDLPQEVRAPNFILPTKAVAELTRLLGKGKTVHITSEKQHMVFKVETPQEDSASGLIEAIYLVSTTIKDTYPNYKQVIPSETVHRVRLERELFQECVHRATLVTSERNQSIALKFRKDGLEISGSSVELGKSHETIAIVYEGPEVSLAFNPQLILEPLKALTKDEIYFEFKDEFSPGLIKTMDSFLCLVMPVRP